MAEYDLGTARGRVVVDTDTKGVDKASDSLDKVGDDAERTAKRVGGISPAFSALTGAIAGAAAVVTSNLINAVQGYVQEAVLASDSTDKFVKALEFNGVGLGTIATLTAQTKAYADETVYSLSDIQNATAQFIANGVEGAADLVEGIGNLNAVAGGTEETFGRVLLASTQTASAGKLTAENWNQIADAIPGGAGALMRALETAGAYTGNFREAMSAGEITADEFNSALLTLGSEPVAVEAAKSVTTMEGAVGNLNAVIVGGLADAISAIKPLLTGMLSDLANMFSFVFESIGNLVSFVNANMDWIGPIAAAVAAATAVWIAWNGAIALWSATTKIAAAVQAAFNAVMAANPIMLIVMAVAALVAGLIYFFTQTELGQQIVANVTRFIQEAWTNVANFLQTLWENITRFFTEAWTNITNFLGPIFEVIGAIIRTYIEVWINIFLVLAAVLVTIWDAIVAAATWVWETIYNFVKPIIDNIVSFITDTFRNFQLGWQIIWDTVSGFFQDVWNNIVNFIRPIVMAILNFILPIIRNIQAGWETVWSAVGSFFSSIWNGIVSAVSGAVNTVFDIVGGIWGTIMGFFTGVGDWLFSVGQDLIMGMVEGISSMLGDIIGAIGDVVNGAIDWAKDVLGIQSPSKVFAEIGNDTMLGLMQGIDDLTPDLEKQINGLGLSMSSDLQNKLEALPVDGEAANTGDNRTQVVNYYAQPGGAQLDAEDELFTAMRRAKVVVPGW